MRFMHLISHDLFCFGVILQKQTISSSESLSNVELQLIIYCLNTFKLDIYNFKSTI